MRGLDGCPFQTLDPSVRLQYGAQAVTEACKKMSAGAKDL